METTLNSTRGVHAAPLKSGSYYQQYVQSKGRAVHDRDVRTSNKPTQLLTDRSAYISFLEIQLERVSAACLTVDGVRERQEEQQKAISAIESHVHNVIGFNVKEATGHMSRVDDACRERHDDSIQRIQQVREDIARGENTRKHALEDARADMKRYVDQHVAHCAKTSQLDDVIRDAVAVQLARMRHEIQDEFSANEEARQKHLHASITQTVKRVVDERFDSLNQQYETMEARLLGMVESRLGGYTDVYSALEKRFAGLLNKHMSAIAARLEQTEQSWRTEFDGLVTARERIDVKQRAQWENSLEDMQVQWATALRQQMHTADADQQSRMDGIRKAVHDLSSNFDQHQQHLAQQHDNVWKKHERRLQHLEHVQDTRGEFVSGTDNDTAGAVRKLDPIRKLIETMQSDVRGVLQTAENWECVANKVKIQSHHAEQTCTRLAQDAMTRIEAHESRLLGRLEQVEGQLREELQTSATLLKKFQEDMKKRVDEQERRLLDMMKGAERKIHTLADSVRTSLMLHQVDDTAGQVRHESSLTPLLAEEMRKGVAALRSQFQRELEQLRDDIKETCAASQSAKPSELPPSSTETMCQDAAPLNLRIEQLERDLLKLRQEGSRIGSETHQAALRHQLIAHVQQQLHTLHEAFDSKLKQIDSDHNLALDASRTATQDLLAHHTQQLAAELKQLRRLVHEAGIGVSPRIPTSLSDSLMVRRDVSPIGVIGSMHTRGDDGLEQLVSSVAHAEHLSALDGEDGQDCRRRQDHRTQAPRRRRAPKLHRKAASRKAGNSKKKSGTVPSVRHATASSARTRTHTRTHTHTRRRNAPK